MTRRLNWWLLGLILLFGLPYYWLLLDNRPGDVPAKPVQIARLRSLAASIPGPAPGHVEMELAAYARQPGTVFAAGTGVKRQFIGIMAFRLPVPGRGAIVIDSGITLADARAFGMEFFDGDSRERIDAALRTASAILLTHEHVDHQGGLVALGDPGVLEKTRFNSAQLPGNPLTSQMNWPVGYRPLATLSDAYPVAIAPGVVTIPAPSHTPGSQLVYVRLANRREYLFTGDIAPLATNWRELRAASRLAGDVLGEEQRSEVFAWLQTIRKLKAEAPDLEVIAGHDYYWISHSPEGRGIRRGFRQ